LAKLRTLKIAVACPHCPEGHSVPADEMFFSDTASSTAPPLVASTCSWADDGSAAHDESAARQEAGDVVGSN
jgi:hypothetical protein